MLDKEPPVSVDVSAEPADLAKGRARWRTAVAGVLAKSTRREVDELGPEPEQMLETPTYEAVAIRALYTALDELPEPPLPGEWPFLRGADALRDVKSGWKVAEAIPANRVAGVAAQDVNSAVLAALAEGVSALLVRVGESGVLPAQLEKVFEGVYLSMAPVILDAGADYQAAGDALLELVSRVEDDQRAILSIDLGADPLTAPLSDRPAPPVEQVVSMAAKVADDHGVRAITVDGPAFHNLGANATWELAGSVAAAVSYLRVLTESGVPVAKALSQISFRLAADDDQFLTIAKVRALRRLWARVADVVGEPDRGAAVVHAETSLAMMTQRDPWVNMLRTTLAAFGAGVGGADTVLVLPVRRRDRGRLSGYGHQFRAPDGPQYSAAAARGVARRPDPGPCRRVVVRRGPHRPVGEPSLAELSKPSSNAADSSTRVTTSRNRSPRSPSGAQTTSRIARPRSPA